MHAIQHRLEQAVALANKGELRAAIEHARSAVRLAPKHAHAWELLARLLERDAQDDAAIEAIRSGVAAAPLDWNLRDRAAHILAGLGRPDLAVQTWRAVTLEHPSRPEGWLGLARALVEARRAEDAIVALDRALAIVPAHVPALYERGRLLERLGRGDEARRDVADARAREPALVEAGILHAKLMPPSEQAQAREALEALLPGAPARLRPPILTELALLADRAGDHARAFALARSVLEEHVKALPPAALDRSLHDLAIANANAITREDVASWPAPRPPASLNIAGRTPIFLVGFPRSGTTLLEQIFAAHPGVRVTDEQDMLQRVRVRLFQSYAPTGDYPRDFARLTPEQVGRARAWYWERSRRAVGLDPKASDAIRIVDKQPLNTLDLCLVRLLFPEARVLFMHRDPRDTVLSVFMQGFARGVPHLFSLDGIAGLYDAFAQLHDHYARTLDLATLDVRYEDLVHAPERVSRAAFEHVGIAWDQRVLEFHAREQRRYVTTPTYRDVATPAHTRAIGRWRAYAQHLAPVLDRLSPWVARWGDPESRERA